MAGLWLDLNMHGVSARSEPCEAHRKCRGLSASELDELTTLAAFNYASVPGDDTFYESLLYDVLLGKIVHCSQYARLHWPLVAEPVPSDVKEVVPFLIAYTTKYTTVYMGFKTNSVTYKSPEIEALKMTCFNGVAVVILPLTPRTLSKDARPTGDEVVRAVKSVFVRSKGGDLSMKTRPFKVVDLEVIPSDMVEAYHTLNREGAVPWTPKVYYEVVKRLRQMSDQKKELQDIRGCFAAFPETLPDTGLTYQKQVTITGVIYTAQYTGHVILVTSTGLEIPLVTLPAKFLPRGADSYNRYVHALPEPITVTFENPDWKSSLKSQLRSRLQPTATEFVL